MSVSLTFPNDVVSIMAKLTRDQAVLDTVTEGAATHDPAASIKALIDAGAKVDYDELVKALAPSPAVFKEVLPLAVAKNPTYDFIRSAIENGLPASTLVHVVVDGKRTTLKIPQLLAREQQWSVLLKLLDDKVFTLQGCGLVVSQLLHYVDCSTADLHTAFTVIGRFGVQLAATETVTPLRAWVKSNKAHIDAVVVQLMRPEHRALGRAVARATKRKVLSLMLSAAHDDPRWVEKNDETRRGRIMSSDDIRAVLEDVLVHCDIGGGLAIALRQSDHITATACQALAAVAEERQRDAAAVQLLGMYWSFDAEALGVEAIKRRNCVFLSHLVEIKGFNGTDGLIREAVQNLDPDIVKMLLDAKADANTRSRGDKPMELLQRVGSRHIVDEIEKNKFEEKVAQVKALLVAAGAKHRW
jgi:hypothetical protein